MDDRTLTALNGSIAKWEGIVAGTVEDDGFDNCPLCQLFHPEKTGYGGKYSGYCDGCPVKAATGGILCRNSPYMDYNPDYVETAQAELDFLRSLLPKDAS